MKKLLMLLAVLVAVALAAPSWAAIEFFGTAKVKPTYYSNFDFDDSEDDYYEVVPSFWSKLKNYFK